MTGLILLTTVVIATAMLAMAVGVIFSNRCLRGSCGGPEVLGPDGESLSCDTCPLRAKARRDVYAEAGPDGIQPRRNVAK